MSKAYDIRTTQTTTPVRSFTSTFVRILKTGTVELVEFHFNDENDHPSNHLGDVKMCEEHENEGSMREI